MGDRELGAPVVSPCQGWVPKTLTPGMKISAVTHPLKDGTHGGQFMAVTLPDGTLKGNPNARAGANAGAAATKRRVESRPLRPSLPFTEVVRGRVLGVELDRLGDVGDRAIMRA